MSVEESVSNKSDEVSVATIPDSPGIGPLQILKTLGICLLVAFVMLVVLIFMAMPRGHGCNGPHHRAIQNAKQWGYALFNFENDYGMYPNEETAEELRKQFPDQAHLLKTDTSNDFMRQLVIAGYIDGDITKDLDSEDFPFAYVVGLNSSVNSAVPLLISPVENGKSKFDEKYARKYYSKRTVVLRIDMSVADPRASSDIFDWSQYELAEMKPRIAWPKR